MSFPLLGFVATRRRRTPYGTVKLIEIQLIDPQEVGVKRSPENHM